MDDDVIIIHSSVNCNRMKPSELINVNISSDFNKVDLFSTNEHPSLSEKQIEMIWERRKRENPKLYNGTKFRFHSVKDQESESEKGIVELNVGVTDYKSFLGTNWADNINELQLFGKQIYGNSQAFLSDALGVGSFLILNDNQIVLLKRNVHCAEAPDMWDVPGGHAEPKNIVGNIPLEAIDTSVMTSEGVRAEIFNSILQEITDEVNIPLTALEKPLYMGTARNNTSGGRPSMEFLIRCSLSSEQVYLNYCTGSQLEADESTNIKFVPLAEIKNLQRTHTELWKNLAPSAKGCIIIYQMTHGFFQN